MADRRWFHGIDKGYGGQGAGEADARGRDFARWVTDVRFDADVVAARLREWGREAEDARRSAHAALGRDDRVEATLHLRDASRFLRMVLLEGWGERLGSMGREWTRFERVARERGASELADRLAALAFASTTGALERTLLVPLWLRERIELAWSARREIGEDVSEAESARDQIAAFAVQVPRHRPQPWGDWLELPDPQLEHRLAELDHLARRICA